MTGLENRDRTHTHGFSPRKSSRNDPVTGVTSYGYWSDGMLTH
ncbi:hypothetical protein [Streptomyces showdoensis]|nr:hypothetical protein [Streptomyces showdoensis]